MALNVSSEGREGWQAGMNIFVEKPLSVKPIKEVVRLAEELKKIQDQNNVTIAVGYMLRYSPAVEVMTHQVAAKNAAFEDNTCAT